MPRATPSPGADRNNSLLVFSFSTVPRSNYWASHTASRDDAFNAAGTIFVKKEPFLLTHFFPFFSHVKPLSGLPNSTWKNNAQFFLLVATLVYSSSVQEHLAGAPYGSDRCTRGEVRSVVLRWVVSWVLGWVVTQLGSALCIRTIEIGIIHSFSTV